MDEVAYWFAPEFLQVAVLREAQVLFAKNDPPSLHLKDMMHADRIKEIEKEVQQCRWKEHVKFDQYHYKTAVLTPTLKKFCASPAVKKIMQVITKYKVKKFDVKLYAFGAGDYILLQDKAPKKKGIRFELDFTEGWNSAWGGYTSFVGREEQLRVLPAQNTCTLVRAEGLQSAIKYVQYHARDKKRVVVRGEIR